MVSSRVTDTGYYVGKGTIACLEMDASGTFSRLEELQDVSKELMEQIRSKMREGLDPEAFLDNVMHFVHSVRWSEPWLVGLFFVEAILATTVVVSRRNLSMQTFLFVLIFLSVYWVENVNRLLSRQWRRFASQNYFDPSGLFLTVVFSGPMLLLMLFIIINNLFQLVNTMVKVKRLELRHRAREAKKGKGKKE